MLAGKVQVAAAEFTPYLERPLGLEEADYNDDDEPLPPCSDCGAQVNTMTLVPCPQCSRLACPKCFGKNALCQQCTLAELPEEDEAYDGMPELGGESEEEVEVVGDVVGAVTPQAENLPLTAVGAVTPRAVDRFLLSLRRPSRTSLMPTFAT